MYLRLMALKQVGKAWCYMHGKFFFVRKTGGVGLVGFELKCPVTTKGAGATGVSLEPQRINAWLVICLIGNLCKHGMI